MKRNRFFLSFLFIGAFSFAQVEFETDVQPIFDNNCALSGCHVAGHSTGLDLTIGNSYWNLVNIPATGYPDFRVKPYDPDNSVLYNKIANTGKSGDIMPPSPSPALSSNEIQKIYDWIVQGAHLQSSAFIGGTIEYDNKYYDNGNVKISVWKDPSAWPYPKDPPLRAMVIGPPVDFNPPIDFSFEDPGLNQDCCYNIAVEFDAENDGSVDAENWWDQDLDLTPGPIENMTILLKSRASGGRIEGNLRFDPATSGNVFVGLFFPGSDPNYWDQRSLELQMGRYNSPIPDLSFQFNDASIIDGNGYVVVAFVDENGNNFPDTEEDVGRTPSFSVLNGFADVGTIDVGVVPAGGYSFDFGATGGYAETNFQDLDGGPEITMEMFIKLHRSFGSGEQVSLFYRESWGGLGYDGNTGEFRFRLENIGEVRWQFSPNPNEWHHISAEYDGANMAIYWDGIVKAQTPAGGALASVQPVLRFGQGFDGLADVIRISNVARHYPNNFDPWANNYNPDNNTSLLYQCNEGSGWILYDDMGNHDANITGNPTWVSDEPLGGSVAEGKISGTVILYGDYAPGQFYLGLWFPGADPDKDNPDMSFQISADPPATEYYEFKSQNIKPNTGPYVVRAFFDVNGNGQFDNDEPRGEASLLYVPSTGQLNDVNIELTSVTTGILAGKIYSPRATSGDLYLALWYSGDPGGGNPDIARGPLPVSFTKPGDFYQYQLDGVEEGSGYYLGVFFDEQGSANGGVDTCDSGRDLWGEAFNVNVAGTTTLDVTLEECEGAQPELQVSTDRLTFEAQEYEKEILIGNTGVGTLYWNATVTFMSGSQWLTIQPDYGDAVGIEEDTVFVTVSPTGSADSALIIVDGYGDAALTLPVKSDTVVVSIAPWVDHGPTIANGSIEGNTPKVGEDIAITAEISSVNGVKSARLVYSRGGESNLSTVDMTPVAVASLLWKGVIPGNDVTPRGLALEIRAVDKLDYTEASSRMNITVEFPSLGLKDLPAETYSMVSVPGELYNKNIDFVLDELGTYDPKQWRVFRWQEGRYLENSGQFIPGSAFWLITREPVTLSTGPGISTDLSEYTIQLAGGWNMIGSPYSFGNDITAPEVTYSNERVEKVLYFYDGSGYRTTSVMEPGEGYWIWSETSAQMTLRPMPGTVAGPRELVSDARGWKANLIARVARFEDRINWFGVHPEAGNERDKYDFHEPPVIGDYVSLAFDNGDWAEGAGQYRTDIRPEGERVYRWNISVKSNVNGIVTLTGEHLVDIPEQVGLILVDRDYRTVQDLRKKPDYRFTNNGAEQERSFVLLAGDRSLLTKEIESMGLLPKQFALAQNTPNPFNPATSIRLSLVEEARVTLKVYNVLGEEVAVLLNGERLSAGFHRLIWNGRDQHGQQAPTGVYLYSVRINGNDGVPLFHDTRKMLLVK